MFGESKKRSFVIMDGSNPAIVKDIKSLKEMVIGRFKRIKIRKLDKDHPTMLVVTIRTGYKQWSELRKLLEREYSELVVFDAPL